MKDNEFYLNEIALTEKHSNRLYLEAYNKSDDSFSHEIDLPLVKFGELNAIFEEPFDAVTFSGGVLEVLPQHIKKMEELMKTKIDADFSKYEYFIEFYPPSLVQDYESIKR
jgi:hypothetical protein